MSDFYDLSFEGTWIRLPRVTSILRIIDKSNALIGWATRLEREAMKAALEEILTAPGDLLPQAVWNKAMIALSGKRAWITTRDRAADIGKQAHAAIHWHIAKMLGREVGPEPHGSEEVTRAVLAFLDWSDQVRFEPLETERTVFCVQCACAGTLDTLGLVSGRLLIVDFKTGKAVYDEAHLQTRFYRHLAAREGLTTEGAMLLRLPKYAGEPGFQAVPAIDIPYRFCQYAKGLWEWQRLMQREEIGTSSMKRCDVEASNGKGSL